MNRITSKVLCFIIGVFALSIFTQCDSTTAEEYKHQAIEYAEKGDHTKAAKAYLKAAEKGDAEAQFIVGFLYMPGNDTLGNPFDTDMDLAIKWIEKSAQQENDDALFVLGMYHANMASNKNIPKAIECLERASNKNNPLASYYLGDLYQKGTGVPIDILKAIKYYDEAYHAGVLMAGLELVNLYLLDQKLSDKYLYGLQLEHEVNQRISELGLDQFDVEGIFRHDFMSHFRNLKI